MLPKMRIIIFLTLALAYSCGSNTNEGLPDISRANIVKLYYKVDFDSTGRQKILSKDIFDLKKVEMIKETINYDPFSYLYCTSTGSMSFYKDSSLIVSMVFNTDPGQMHIACNYNGKLVAVKLSEENAKLLVSFKN